MFESEVIEFKRELNDSIIKEIIAFCNTNGGTIIIGYDDNGIVIGLENAKADLDKLSSKINDSIEPSVNFLVSSKIETENGKEIIVIKVLKGINKPYYVKSKGMTTDGVYVRLGETVQHATKATIKEMIIESTGITFEKNICINQNLTFDYATKIFKNNGIDIDEINVKRNLNFITDKKIYTNLALLFSDQNPFSIKVAAYQSKGKENFIDRKEFKGSILQTYNDLVDYLKLNSATYGIVDSTTRVDIEEFPEFIIREIALNSIIHRDYSVLTSNIVNIYKDSEIEFISYGSLYGNVTLQDILNGLSTTRNPYLQSIFMRLNEVEALGSGLRRVNEFYKNRGQQLEIKALPSSFIVELPRISFEEIEQEKSDMEKIISFIDKNGSITRKDAEKILGKERTTVTEILNTMIENGRIKKVGNSSATKYEKI